jgi:CHAT domain-containing protein
MSSTITNGQSATITPELFCELSQLHTEKARLAFLRKHKLLTREAVLELNSTASKELRINTGNALSLAEAAVLAARAIGDGKLLAQSYRIQANVHAGREEYQAAVDLYGAALHGCEELQDADGAARTLVAAIQPHIILGEYARAFELADAARKILLSLGDHRRLARLENNIGNIYHRQDRLDVALEHYERAYQQLLPYADTEELTISLNNMSMCLIGMNNFSQAMATYEGAKKLLEARDMPLLRSVVEYNIAYLHYLRGNYHRAIEMLKATRAAGEKLQQHYLVALCYLDLSDIYVELNQSSEAIDAGERGFALFRKLDIAYEAGKALANQAIALGQAGKTRRALDLFAESKVLFEKENNQAWPRLIDLYQAVILFEASRFAEARGIAFTAAEFFDASILRTKAALCHLLLAQIAIETGDTREAELECSRATDLINVLGMPNLSFQAYFLRGRIQQAKGELRSAYAEYQLARNELESLRSNVSRDELKISFMKNKSELYERLVSLCLSPELSGYSSEEAFRYIELAKSRSLMELIQFRSDDDTQEDLGPNDGAKTVRNLREELNWYEHRIQAEELRQEKNASGRIEKLREERATREKALLSALAEASGSQADAQEARGDVMLPLEKIQRLLSDDASIVEYYFAEDRILAVVVGKKSLEITHVADAPRVHESLRLLRFQLARAQFASESLHSITGNIYDSTVAHLRELYKALIAPVRSQLTGRHLVLVPHGALHFLPFQALHDGERFLLDSYTTSYAPSAAVYALCRTKKTTTDNGSLIFGVDDAAAPLIAEEARAVHESLPGSELFLGEAANHDLLLRKSRSSRLVHIATHGKFRPDNPMFSGIRLGDGWLHVYELYQMKLSAELLTLSGCATGLNVIGSGDELLGLIRAALSAGARSLLLTLWDVNDRSTSKFMSSFYRGLPTANSKAEALAEAAKEIRHEFPHPYYWAPFILVGNDH